MKLVSYISKSLQRNINNNTFYCTKRSQMTKTGKLSQVSRSRSERKPSIKIKVREKAKYQDQGQRESQVSRLRSERKPSIKIKVREKAKYQDQGQRDS